MSATDNPADSLREVEWADYTAHLPQHVDGVLRMLAIVLAHDVRRQDGDVKREVAGELASEAVAWVAAHRSEAPADAPPALWLRKVALTLLDERLEKEAIANGGVYRSWAGETGSPIAPLLEDARERSRWSRVAERVEAESRGEPVRQAAGPQEEHERIRALERALLRLPEVRRRAVTHHYLDHLAHNEIGFLLEISVDEVALELDAGLKGIWLEMGLAAR
jgi:DNA-directed RNA polymerase specialized sigma24 family protein